MAKATKKPKIEVVANNEKSLMKDAPATADEIQEDIGEKAEKVKEAASETLESAKEAASEGLETAKEGFDTAKEAASEGFDTAKEAASEGYDKASSWFKRMLTVVPHGAMEIFTSIKEATPAIHGAGYPFIIAFLVGTIVIDALLFDFMAVGLILTAWCVYFFRNPKRTVPSGNNLIVSPADGRVTLIQKVKPPVELGLGDDERTRVSVFLNVFDVHVNRVPAKGTITKTHYHEGAFFNASLDKASEENERQLVALKMDSGDEIGFIQIAGLVARRIICTAQEGQEVEAGSEYGLIRFGSRVDVFLPKGVKPQVVVGQRCVGGETIIGDIKRKAGLSGGTER